jgi:phosphonate transport system substrate-binding protein
MSRNMLFLAAVLVALTTVAGCGPKDKPTKIRLQDLEDVPGNKQAAAATRLRIAVGGMITPKEGLAYYRSFLNYLETKLGRPVEYVDREDYGEINNLLRSGNLDAAFVCSGPYVAGHDEFGLELLVAPQAYGETVYFSYILVAADSPLQSFEELRGKRFAFTDPLSNTGKLAPTYMLAKISETPDTFFKNYIFTKSHDKAIRAVAEHIVDGAAVDSLIWEYAQRTNPVFTARTRVLRKSDPYGIPPVVVSPDVATDLKEQLREIFLNAHQDAEGREILRKMMIDKFVVVEDRAYESVREMKAWIATHKPDSTEPK